MPSSNRGKVFRNSKYNGQSSSKGRGQYINPQKFINQATPQAEQEAFVPAHQFSDFGFSKVIQNNLGERGYVTPTPIQDGSIKAAMDGRDVIGLANTGTGKTAAFALPIIHRLSTRLTEGTSLIMAPTRELAAQIDEEMRSFSKHTGIQATLCVGGVSMQRQIVALRRNPKVVIGTPGRLKDLFQQGVLKLGRVGIVVLDEADRMLDMGFSKDINFLLGKLPEKRQSLCFSATITPEIQRLLDVLLTNPVTVSVRTSETSDHVEQDVIRAMSKEHKIELLTELLQQSDYDKVLVFGQTKWAVQKLADNLSRQGIKAAAIHGNKTQPQRMKALKAFSDGAVSVLVATDVASRGLDIPNVSHVINFDQPTTYDDYIHRIGRTGRAGNQGKALTFI